MPHNTADDLPLEIAGLRIQRPSRDASFAEVIERSKREPVRVGWIYANCVNIAARDDRYRDDVNGFEFLFNDGAGIELAGKVLGRPVRDNLCGTDWIPDLLSHLNEAGPWRRVFLLGSSDTAVVRARETVGRRWPNLIVCGAHSGYFDDAAPILAEIAGARPEILLIGMGVPKQERFISDHWFELMDAGIRIALAGGAIIDHLGGMVTRAPRLWRRLRLEWLWRLLTEPRRLWRRYLLGNAAFLFRLGQQWRKSG
ncbi:MAG: glycosyltransferase [Candidatus Dadabacteria bacterium]|nr:MAG: glycosyltransferase [Candidatus Dadabacteria bacterium]